MKVLPVILALLVIGTAVWFVPRTLKSSFMRESEKTYILCVEQVTEQLLVPTSASFQIYSEAVANEGIKKFYWAGWVESENESGVMTQINFNCARNNNSVTLAF